MRATLDDPIKHPVLLKITQISDSYAKYSPSDSTKNYRSSHCCTADQEPSAHYPLSCLWGKGHCSLSRLQSHFSNGAVLPWPQMAPDATAATTLRTKTDNYNRINRERLRPTLNGCISTITMLTNRRYLDCFSNFPKWISGLKSCLMPICPHYINFLFSAHFPHSTPRYRAQSLSRVLKTLICLWH